MAHVFGRLRRLRKHREAFDFPAYGGAAAAELVASHSPRLGASTRRPRRGASVAPRRRRGGGHRGRRGVAPAAAPPSAASATPGRAPRPPACSRRRRNAPPPVPAARAQLERGRAGEGRSRRSGSGGGFAASPSSPSSPPSSRREKNATPRTRPRRSGRERSVLSDELERTRGRAVAAGASNAPQSWNSETHPPTSASAAGAPRIVRDDDLRHRLLPEPHRLRLRSVPGSSASNTPPAVPTRTPRPSERYATAVGISQGFSFLSRLSARTTRRS